ncbi:DUF1294 domain-containing protein [Muribacter muris]|uniref:DUF1294 domain-containing protein n=1 Tax=Muribacter muris TaxID=67855 RepID=A0A4Y9JSN7_9PAST|nr:DUF1294 domain-containing protein [Muribacter muris]MBF0785659.1 DUF1294 domain-containing protein [Muribacter muris]MBF0828330.1 DUF1294 domain-containing protein [Muribacter muris]TFV08833.1 DUF1294 domain-containing protein [Muribacter muris]
MLIFVCGYLLGINLLGLYLMYVDKQKSLKKHWRIPESNLLFICACGGFIGIYLGMKYIRHKTKHWQFHFAVITSVLGWLGLAIFYVYLQ